MAINLRSFVVIVICFVFVSTQDEREDIKCVNDLVKWCENMKKAPNFVANFLTTDYTSYGERRAIYCMAGSGGQNCSMNNVFWFGCRPDGSVMYKNSVLQENVPVPDGDICDASKRALNSFNYDPEAVQAALSAGRETYQRAMNNVQNTMNNVQRRLGRPCFPFCNSNPFGNGFPFNG